MAPTDCLTDIVKIMLHVLERFEVLPTNFTLLLCDRLTVPFPEQSHQQSPLFGQSVYYLMMISAQLYFLIWEEQKVQSTAEQPD